MGSASVASFDGGYGRAGRRLWRSRRLGLAPATRARCGEPVPRDARRRGHLESRDRRGDLSRWRPHRLPRYDRQTALARPRPARHETRSQSRKRARAVLLTGRRQGRVLHGASGRLAHSVVDGWSVDAVGARLRLRFRGRVERRWLGLFHRRRCAGVASCACRRRQARARGATRHRARRVVLPVAPDPAGWPDRAGHDHASAGRGRHCNGGRRLGQDHGPDARRPGVVCPLWSPGCAGSRRLGTGETL